MNYELPRNINARFAMYATIKEFARKFDDFAIANHYLDLADMCYRQALALDDDLWF